MYRQEDLEINKRQIEIINLKMQRQHSDLHDQILKMEKETPHKRYTTLINIHQDIVKCYSLLNMLEQELQRTIKHQAVILEDLTNH